MPHQTVCGDPTNGADRRRGAPFFAAMQFVATQGLLVPRDISLLCTDSSPLFHWNRPAIAHIH
jgi:hypothetical protein